MGGETRIGQKVRSARKVAGLTQAEFAAALDVPQPRVSESESGQQALRGVIVAKLCAISPAGGAEIPDAMRGEWSLRDNSRGGNPSRNPIPSPTP